MKGKKNVFCDFMKHNWQSQFNRILEENTAEVTRMFKAPRKTGINQSINLVWLIKTPAALITFKE